MSEPNLNDVTAEAERRAHMLLDELDAQFGGELDTADHVGLSCAIAVGIAQSVKGWAALLKSSELRTERHIGAALETLSAQGGDNG